jgi:hypothetical protein
VNDPNVLNEKAREEREGFAACCCSNCNTPAATHLMANLPFASVHNFDEVWSNHFQTSKVADPKSKLPVKRTTFRKRKVPEAERGLIEAFQVEIAKDFPDFYYSRFPTSATVQADDLFGKTEAEAIGSYMHQIQSTEDLRIVIGGEFVDGQLAWIMERITLYNNQLTQGTRLTNPSNAKKPRLQGVQVNNQEQPPIQETTSTTKKLTKKQEEAILRRRISLEKAAARKLEKEHKEKRRLQIATILAEGRAEYP